MLLLLLSCFTRVRPWATPQTAAHQAPQSLGFFRQEYWSGMPLPYPVGRYTWSNKRDEIPRNLRIVTGKF